MQRPDRLPVSACDSLSTSDARLLQGSCFYYGWPTAIGRFGNSGVGILKRRHSPLEHRTIQEFSTHGSTEAAIRGHRHQRFESPKLRLRWHDR
jgi:hypothetical protein